MENLINNKIENLTKIMLDYGRTKCVIKSAEEDFNYVQQYLPAVRGYAEHLIGQGYRKESDTAREILDEAKKWVKAHYKDKVTDSFGERPMLFMEAFGCLFGYLKEKYGVDLGE